MPTVADVIDDVIGVDTHTDTHTLVCCSPAGAVRGELTVDNSTDGFAEALTWATMLASGPSLIFGIEGTRSYGQALSEFLSRAGLVVVEVERPARRSVRTPAWQIRPDRRQGRCPPGAGDGPRRAAHATRGRGP